MAQLRLGECPNEAELAVCMYNKIKPRKSKVFANMINQSSISRILIFQITGLYHTCSKFRYTVGLFHNILHIASTRKTTDFVVCDQQTCRAACASAQFDQRLCYSLSGNIKTSRQMLVLICVTSKVV